MLSNFALNIFFYGGLKITYVVMMETSEVMASNC